MLQRYEIYSDYANFFIYLVRQHATGTWYLFHVVMPEDPLFQMDE